jgi:hypothetical protein
MAAGGSTSAGGRGAGTDRWQSAFFIMTVSRPHCIVLQPMPHVIAQRLYRVGSVPLSHTPVAGSTRVEVAIRQRYCCGCDIMLPTSKTLRQYYCLC